MSTPNYLEIRELKIKTKIGIHDWEQLIDQTLLIDITLPLESHPARITLEQTIDYASLCQHITDFISQGQFDLIENVANALIDLIFSQYSVAWVKIGVSKPCAVPNARNIKVVAEKSNS